MKIRDITIFSGQSFHVPQGIQRIDTRATHGWQVRYQGTKMFSDHSADGTGAPAALAKATAELLRRIAALPAPVTLQKEASANKTNSLPPGISGPILRQRAGSTVRSASLSVLIPRFGQTARVKSLYIGTEQTYTAARFRLALARAVELRRQAELTYAEAATKARRKAARMYKATLRAAAAQR